jgi:Rrf2 family transcriptional repressor of oqxAB
VRDAQVTDAPECLVTNHSAEYFVRLTDETEAAVLGGLAGRTLADSLDELRAIDRSTAGR